MKRTKKDFCFCIASSYELLSHDYFTYLLKGRWCHFIDISLLRFQWKYYNRSTCQISTWMYLTEIYISGMFLVWYCALWAKIYLYNDSFLLQFDWLYVLVHQLFLTCDCVLCLHSCYVTNSTDCVPIFSQLILTLRLIANLCVSVRPNQSVYSGLLSASGSRLQVWECIMITLSSVYYSVHVTSHCCYVILLAFSTASATIIKPFYQSESFSCHHFNACWSSVGYSFYLEKSKVIHF